MARIIGSIAAPSDDAWPVQRAVSAG